jgi:hypothetical protein
MKITGFQLGEKRQLLIPEWIGLLCLFLLLLGRAYESYAAFWWLGACAFVFILLFGTVIERLVIITFLFLSLIAPDELMKNDFRTTAFLSFTMAFGRYGLINPYLNIAAQIIAMQISLVLETQSIEAFAFAPSVIFLMIASRITKGSGLKNDVKYFILVLMSLLFAIIGYGSRSALIIWLLSMLKRSRVMFIIFLLALSLAFYVSLDIPVINKINDSISELTLEMGDSGALNLRATELAIFSEYISVASYTEILSGSTRLVYLPSEILGTYEDLLYLPHNQILGLFFQFGVLGLLLFVTYSIQLVRYFSKDKECAYLLMSMLPVFMLFKHGFLDSDLALILASLNWLYTRNIRK